MLKRVPEKFVLYFPLRCLSWSTPLARFKHSCVVQSPNKASQGGRVVGVVLLLPRAGKLFCLVSKYAKIIVPMEKARVRSVEPRPAKGEVRNADAVPRFGAAARQHGTAIEGQARGCASPPLSAFEFACTTTMGSSSRGTRERTTTGMWQDLQLKAPHSPSALLLCMGLREELRRLDAALSAR